MAQFALAIAKGGRIANGLGCESEVIPPLGFRVGLPGVSSPIGFRGGGVQRARSISARNGAANAILGLLPWGRSPTADIVATTFPAALMLTSCAGVGTKAFSGRGRMVAMFASVFRSASLADLVYAAPDNG